MVLSRGIFFIALLTLPLTATSQRFSVKKDLTLEKLKFENDEFVPAEPDESLQTSYFLIDAGEKDYLEIKSARTFTVFINGKMAASELSHACYSIDSLKTKFSSPELRVGAYSPEAP